jgi:hypothetical protein
MKKRQTPGEALSKLIEAKVSGKSTVKAQKAFDKAQDCWAKEVTTNMFGSVIIMGDKQYVSGKLIK